MVLDGAANCEVELLPDLRVVDLGYADDVTLSADDPQIPQADLSRRS